MDPAAYGRSPEPVITIFHCARCCGEMPVHCGHGCRLVAACASEVDASRIRAAFLEGADGVMVMGCLGRNCLGQKPDIDAFLQIHDGAMAMHRLGVDPARLVRVWLTPRETAQVPAMILAFRRRLNVMGPRFAARTPVPAPDTMSAAGG